MTLTWSPDMFGGDVQLAIDTVYSIDGGGVINLGSTMWDVDSALNMQPNIVLEGYGGGLKRFDGASTGALVNMADKSGLANIVLDGNRGSAAINSNSFLAYVGAADDTFLENCTLKETIGSGVIIGTGKRPRLKGNSFDRCAALGLTVWAPAGHNETQGIFRDNMFRRIGQHPIALIYSDLNYIENNTVYGELKTGIIANIDKVAKTVTRVSGPDFTGIEPGQFIIFNGNTEELHISEVVSANVLKFETNMTTPSVTNAICGVGTGDLINLMSCSHNKMTGNTLRGGAGCGFVIWDDNVNIGIGNRVFGNSASSLGSAGYSTQGQNKTIATDFDDNLSYNCGLHGAAGHLDFNSGITVQYGSKTKLSNNFTYSDTGSMTHGIIVRSGTLLGSVFASDNVAEGVSGTGIKNAIGQIILGPQWGSTAYVNTVVSNGRTILFSVMPNGTGITSAPLFSILPVVIGGGRPMAATVTMQVSSPASTSVGYVINAAPNLIMANLPLYTPMAGVPVYITVQI